MSQQFTLEENEVINILAHETLEMTLEVISALFPLLDEAEAKLIGGVREKLAAMDEEAYSELFSMLPLPDQFSAAAHTFCSFC